MFTKYNNDERKMTIIMVLSSDFVISKSWCLRVEKSTIEACDLEINVLFFEPKRF